MSWNNKERLPIITISREYGAGGRTIAKKLSEKLNIPWYDSDFVKLTAETSGYSEEIVADESEEISSFTRWLESMLNNVVDYTSSHDAIFLAQKEVMLKLAKEPCIIVGRCADYALADFDNCVNLFIYGDMDKRIERITEKYKLSEKETRDLIIKKDKQRASYYNFYSSKKWGSAETYDLCINSSVLGIDGTVELLVNYVNNFEKKQGF